MPKHAKPRAGSWNDWLSTFDLTERRYVETALDRYGVDMGIIRNPTRLPPDRKFTTSLFVCLHAGRADDIRYLICVERVK